MTERRTEEVELTSSESVGERGTTRLTWRVRVGDGWVGAADYPGVTIERLAAGPGTIWEIRLVLELPTGTLLMRVDSRPGEPQRGDVLDFLARAPRLPPRRVRRTLYRVGPRGALVAAQPE
ncbi:MAG: hypothetical protein OZ921_01285 [Sorangiineae bacterium]|nr:hypothetical protein [Polyangiaceae bacterium]MEB2321117.1 hypothetical protein [Sorangiineae bacterium]